MCIVGSFGQVVTRKKNWSSGWVVGIILMKNKIVGGIVHDSSDLFIIQLSLYIFLT